jgi:hypothetical protein
MILNWLGIDMFLGYNVDATTAHKKFFQVCKMHDGYDTVVIYFGRFELYVSRTRKTAKSNAGVSES